MDTEAWHIYVGQIPYREKGDVWVSFESEPTLKTTRSNIYGRCLPCIQNLYDQLKEGAAEIALGNAYNCWKVTAVLNGMDECLALLQEFEKRFPKGHVYGKFGTGRPLSKTMVVVFHTENPTDRDRIRERLALCLPGVNRDGEIKVSRACAVLYEVILGDWRDWRPVTPIRYPERVEMLLERIKQTLFWAAM